MAAAREAGTLDLGVETIAVERFKIIADRILRTDPASGATTHLLEIEIARMVRPLAHSALMARFGLGDPRHRPMHNHRSGRVALAIPASRLIDDDAIVIERVELVRPLARDYLTLAALAESSWEEIAPPRFAAMWDAECASVAGLKTERLHLATGLLLPVWDKLPTESVHVTRLAAADGRTLIGREVPASDVPALGTALGIDIDLAVPADELGPLVLKSGKAMPLIGPEPLQVKRSLVNGSQRLELTGFSGGRLDWYKAQGCFTEIIRYQTRLFVPANDPAPVLARIMR